MIDFRYHIVSIAAVFLALAVGVALGAGPLNGAISDTVQAEVTKLREERVDLRAETDAANQRAEQRDAFVADNVEVIVADRLVGTDVSVLRFSALDSDVVDDVTQTLSQAGARVAAGITLGSIWLDPSAEAAAQRAQVGSTALIRMQLPVPDTTLPEVAAVVALLTLGQEAVTPPDGDTGGFPDPGVAERRDAGLAALTEGGLLEVDGDWPSHTEAVLILGGEYGLGDETTATATSSATATASATATSSASAAPSQTDAAPNGSPAGTALVQLSRAVGAAVGATVVATTGVPDEQVRTLVGAVRDNEDARRRVSTVDTTDTPIGLVSVVYALAQQLTSGVGHYGTGFGATTPYPAPASTPTTATRSADESEGAAG